MLYIIFGLVLFVGVFAQSPGLGGCPSVTPEKSLDRNKLSGQWYLVETSKPNIEDLFVKCVSVNASDPNEHGASRVLYSLISTISGKHWKVRGNVKPDTKACGNEKEGCSKFIAQTLGFREAFSILGTDYSSYAITWSCRNLVIAHVSVIAVYTRDQHPDQSVLDKVAEVLANNNLQNITLEKSKQDCS